MNSDHPLVVELGSATVARRLQRRGLLTKLYAGYSADIHFRSSGISMAVLEGILLDYMS